MIFAKGERMTLITPEAPTSPPPGSSMLLRHISWQSYESLREDIGDDGIHLTYDDGLLEIEVPSKRHEQLKKAVARLVEMTLESSGQDYEPLGSTTWNRKALLKGIEADECYYVANAARIRGKESIVIGEDPPPDLAIEVEVFSSAIDKLAIYAALKIPEVWRVLEDASVIFLKYEVDGYQPIAASEALPSIRSEQIAAQLRQLAPLGPLAYPEMLRQFAAWLKSQ